MLFVKPVHQTIFIAAAVAVAIPLPGRGQVANELPHFDYKQIQLLEDEKKYDLALAKADEAVEADPKSIAPYVLRGHIYSDMEQWDKADADFQTILQLDPDNFPAKFNRCEVKLAKKDYDNARGGYLALEKNADWGDLAAYKVFVCDLFAGHQLDAKSELEAFNRAGSHPSYFYGNATWSFYHKQTEEGKGWIASASRIFPAKIQRFYSATLIDNGYMPPLVEDLKVP